MPTEEQKIKNMEAHEKLQNLITGKNFSNSLFDSDRNDPRNNDFNCPENCKELLAIFINHGGKDEAIKMIKDFDKYWPKTC